MKKMTPERAIRKYCLRCSCGDKNEVELCNIISCPLYDYRLGESKTTEEQVDETTVGDLLDVKGSKVVLETTETQETDKTDVVNKESEQEIVEETKKPEKKERKPRKKKETKVETESKQEETKVETESKQEETKVETESKQEEPVEDLSMIDLDDLFD